MARINLLPWREEYRQEKKQEFFKHLAVSIVFAAIIAFIWVRVVGSSIDDQKARNFILNNEIKLLSDQVKEIQELKNQRKTVLERMKIIQELQGTRPIIVRYFDQFAQSIPDGIYVTNLSRIGNIFSVEGVSESNNRVSNFMRNLDASSYFVEPNLLDVANAPDQGEQFSRFTLTVKLTTPDDKKEAE